MRRLLTSVVLWALAAPGVSLLAQTAEITNCPGSYSFSHCNVAHIDFNATGEGDVFFELVSGPGQLDPVGGLWIWAGETIPQSGSEILEVRAIDDNGPGPVCTVDIEITNEAPTILCPAVATARIRMPRRQIVQTDDDCDELTVTVLDDGGVSGEVLVIGDTIQYTAASEDHGLFVTFWVEVSDGEKSSTCDMHWNVVSGAPAVAIEPRLDQLQGQFTEVDVILHAVDPTQGMGGFEFLIAYDASALFMPSALEGEVYAECGWEYFTYRTVTNCPGGCPSGLLRVIGIASDNVGPSGPGCDSPDAGYVQQSQLPMTLFSLRFMVSNDRNLQCQFVPIKFFWVECGDNALSNHDGSELGLSYKVFDYVDPDNYPFISGEITGDGTQLFPTFFGAPDECVYEEPVGGKIAKRLYDLQNGGVGIICASQIDDRGDINQNKVIYEIADAVMYTNYFLIGLPAFYNHIEGSIAASDTNADGIPLTVADLVYLIRVVTGEISPFNR